MIRRSSTCREGSYAPVKAAGCGARRTRRRRPGVEALGGRALLSFLGSESRVSLNPQATDNSETDNASSPDRTSVAVWVNTHSNTDNDIWAQRFDSYGHAAGAPTPVDVTHANSLDPHMSMDGQGRFAVTWSETGVGAKLVSVHISGRAENMD